MTFKHSTIVLALFLAGSVGCTVDKDDGNQSDAAQRPSGGETDDSGGEQDSRPNVSWVVDTFSFASHAAGYDGYRLNNLTFQRNGRVRLAFSECHSEQETDVARWRPLDDTGRSIEILPLPDQRTFKVGVDDYGKMIVTEGRGCETIDVRFFRVDGREYGSELSFDRGARCMFRDSAGSCDYHLTNYWCDGSRPSCEEPS